MIALLASLGFWFGQADEIQTITLNLSSEQVATVEARKYRPGEFAVNVNLNAPCTKVLAELTKTYTGSYFRLEVAGHEVFFTQVYQEITSGQISIPRKRLKEAELLAERLRPNTDAKRSNVKARCSNWNDL